MSAALSARRHAARTDATADLARSKVMALRFVAQLGAIGTARRAALARRLRDADLAAPSDDAGAAVRAAVRDPEVIHPAVEVTPFLTALAQLTRDTVGSDGAAVADALARRADDVVRALLVHSDPALRTAFDRLYAPFEPDIGFDRLLLG
ncbi:MAG TPA: hypothetical protein VGD56_11310 [Gemmatirosa sp.]